MFVDDNKINQRVAAKLFKRIGCQLTIANDGVEALQIIKNNTFEFVFLDSHMPGINRGEVVKRIHMELGNDRPWIIAMSSQGECSDRSSTFGVDDKIDKPLGRHAVIEALKKRNATQIKG